MSRSGDDRVVWDATQLATGDPAAVAAVQEAERIFREQRERGATAFTVEKGRAPARIETFDSAAEQIVLIPRLVGG
ncbi:MAG: hypothetical protein ACRDHP_16850 [Ktedonobacterales bacterium]